MERYRRERHRQFHALPFARKLELIGEMGEQIAHSLADIQCWGLLYIDPFTSAVVRPRADSILREDPSSVPGPRA